jgi:hypothetical protein
VNLDEALRVEVLAEEVSNTGLDLEDGLVGDGLCERKRSVGRIR